MSITKYLLLKWYCSMKKNEKDLNHFWHRKLTLKVRIWQFLTTFMQVYQRPNSFIMLFIDLEQKGWPCKMCKSVRQKLGHSNKLVHGMVNVPFFPSNRPSEYPYYQGLNLSYLMHHVVVLVCSYMANSLPSFFSQT